jgi:hypothetical protein
MTRNETLSRMTASYGRAVIVLALMVGAITAAGRWTTLTAQQTTPACRVCSRARCHPMARDRPVLLPAIRLASTL